MGAHSSLNLTVPLPVGEDPPGDMGLPVEGILVIVLQITLTNETTRTSSPSGVNQDVQAADRLKDSRVEAPSARYTGFEAVLPTALT